MAARACLDLASTARGNHNLSESTDTPASTFNAAVYQYTGSDTLFCTDTDDIDRARVAFLCAEANATSTSPTSSLHCSFASSIEANKAEKRDVILKAVDGSTSTMRVPSSATTLAPSRTHGSSPDEVLVFEKRCACGVKSWFRERESSSIAYSDKRCEAGSSAPLLGARLRTQTWYGIVPWYYTMVQVTRNGHGTYTVTSVNTAYVV